MTVSKAALKSKLAASTLAPLAHLDIQDLSDGCGANYAVLLVSPAFEGLKLLQRHKLVNEALAGEIAQIHAFSQKCLTPAEWAKQQQ